MKLFRITGAAVALAMGISLLAMASAVNVYGQETPTTVAGDDGTATGGDGTAPAGGTATGDDGTPSAGGGVDSPTTGDDDAADDAAGDAATPGAGGAESLPETGSGGEGGGFSTTLLLAIAGATLIAGAGVVAAGSRRS
jgi:hypothetical protein